MDNSDKKVYSKQLDRKILLPFLRLNFVDEYNFDMNSVDRADQLRGNYSVGQGLRQRKWWWSIFVGLQRRDCECILTLQSLV